jgi:hypothetical protein
MPPLFSLRLNSSDLRDLKRNFAELKDKQVPFLTAYALTKTGQDIKEAEITEMKSVFDRPTPFALNALQLEPATKAKLEAKVGFKAFAPKGTPGEKFLKAEVESGARAKKRHERALERVGVLRSNEFTVPSSIAPLDAYGNLSGSLITRILSDIRANPDHLSSSTGRTRKRRRMAGKGQYFVLRNQGRAPNGIYFRLGLRDIRPILIFVKQPVYKQRFDFYGVAHRVFEANYAKRFEEGFERFVLPKLARKMIAGPSSR